MDTPSSVDQNPFRDPPEAMDSANRSTEQPSSIDNSRPGSAGGIRPKEKKRVGFSGAADLKDHRKSLTILNDRTANVTPPAASPTFLYTIDDTSVNGSSHSRDTSGDALLAGLTTDRAPLPQDIDQQLRNALSGAISSNNKMAIPRPRPALRRGYSNSSATSDIEDPAADTYENQSARIAHERARRLERDERIKSAPTSRRGSPSRTSRSSAPKSPQDFLGQDIPLKDLAIDSDAIESDEDDNALPSKTKKPSHAEAQRLVRAHTVAARDNLNHTPGTRSGYVTPIEEQEMDPYYVPKPEKFRGGVLASLLKLYNQEQGSSSRSPSMSQPGRAHLRNGSSGAYSAIHSTATTPQHSPPTSGTATPVNGRSHRPWYSMSKSAGQSTTSLSRLVSASAMGASPVSGLAEAVSHRLKEQAEQQKREEQQKRPGAKRSRSSGMLGRLSRPRLEDEIRITIHIAETIARQRYLMKLCRALMLYGAPTHRLEEYMKMSARVLEIEAQFLYIPGSMIISFDDTQTHTTEVKLVRITQGLDLGKLRDTHEVYKEVVHDRIGVEEATQRIDEVLKRPARYKPWALIPVYGLASASVGPFAFGARPIDLPIAFVLGCILGILQLIIAPRSDLYQNVFEIAASVITSFLARAFGSIKGGEVFCFSALAQSSIALILPGYTVLCAALELQSRSIVAGSVRMVYAIIYSLFLGFGITIGTALYGIMDSNAISETSCRTSIGHHYFFISVPIFAMCLIIINQAKWKQAPVMVFIAFAGYVVNYFSSKRFSGNTQVANTLGALAIGVLANGYSRLGQRVENWFLDLWEDRLRPVVKRFRRFVLRKKRKPFSKLEAAAHEEHVIGDGESAFVRHTRRVGYGLAAAAMLPAIFVQVPSGLAVSGSLISGVASADEITGNSTNGTTVVNSTTETSVYGDLNSVVFNVGYSVIQVAIGITVGLFLSAVIVYPFGKRRSGLFSF